MKEKLKTYGVFSLALLLQCHPLIEAGCVKSEKSSDCIYTVMCSGVPTSADTPNCNSPTNVTLILTNSSRDVLTKGYFSSTNFDARVKTIRAHGNSWKTLDADALGYYRNTMHMDLSENNIYYLRDTVFERLTDLRYLNLSHNFIEDFTKGTFVGSTKLNVIDISYNKVSRLAGYVFHNMVALQTLKLSHNSMMTLDEYCFSNTQNNKLNAIDLSYNKIVRIKLNTFQYLTALETLDLSHNAIIALDDNCFNGLNHLISIDFTDNFLSSFNVSLIHLKSLNRLTVSNNNFTKLDSYELKRLTSLEMFDFKYNLLTTIDVNLFQPFVGLMSADLSYNQIKGQINANIFKYNQNLRTLRIQHNHFTFIEENSFANTKIDDFNFAENNYSGEIRQFTLSGLDEVDRLNLSNQSITAIRSKAFSNMKSLSWVNLSVNFIEVVESDSINLARSLRTIDLSNNKLNILNSTFIGLSKLEVLYLQNNSINVIVLNAFLNVSSLHTLDLSFNHISIIEPNVLPLKSLKTFYFTKNCLTGEVKRNVLSPAPVLTQLDISEQSLTKLSNDSFVDLELTKNINLSSNAIQTIEFNSFKDLNSLETLDLSRNNITDLQFNKNGMKQLRNLFVANNYIEIIMNDTFSLLHSLENVDLSSNKIVSIPSNLFSSCSLRSLNIANNKIGEFDNAFTHFTNISILNLSANRITTINLTFYAGLTELDLSDNQLNSTTERFLDYLSSNITRLNLSKNNITSLSPGIFINASSLLYLNVSHNRLPVLRYGALRGLTRLKVLDVSGNRLQELDVDLFHECPHLLILVVDYNSIASIDVFRLTEVVKELKKLSLGGNPMSCKEVVGHVKNGSLHLEIDSVNKVYHVDNVNGIECGKVYATGAITTTLASSHSSTSSTSGTMTDATHALLGVVFLWCSVISLFVLVIFVAMYYFRRNLLAIYAASRYEQRVSLELNSSQY